jgi:hypothetical protein
MPGGARVGFVGSVSDSRSIFAACRPAASRVSSIQKSAKRARTRGGGGRDAREIDPVRLPPVGRRDELRREGGRERGAPAARGADDDDEVGGDVLGCVEGACV